MTPLGETEPDTLHDDLSAAFDAVAADTSAAAAETPPETTQSTQPGTAEVANGATAVASPTTGERARGPDGKFIPKADGVDSPPPAAKGVAASTAPPPKLATPSTDAAKASTDAPSTAPDAPPVGWMAEGKAEWASLSPAVKAAVLKREVEISSGGRQWSEEKRRYEEIVAPVRQAASRRGISEAEGIQRLMAAQERLDRNPVEAIQWLAQAYRVPITVNGQSPINGQPAADGSSRIEPPVYRDERIDAIQARLDAQDRRETEMTVQRVTAFATDPSHPHFDAVSAEVLAMLPLLQSRNPRASPEELLQSAYDSAVHANPDTRRAVAAQLAADADAQRRSTNSAEVAKARLASSSIRPGAPAGIPASGPKDSIREELLAAWQ